MMVLEMLHDGVVGEQSVFVGTRLEGRGNDISGITMIRNHYILIETTREDRKASSIISIKFADVFNPDVKFIGWYIVHDWRAVVFGLICYGLGKSDTLE